jgi:RND superfamily putative drug exporter
MVVVFSVFVTMKFTMIQQLGLGLAVAVFVDATVIRSILLPAVMRLLGDWNWYLPSFLGWLPRVTIESGVHEALPDSHQSADRSPGWHLPIPSRSPEGTVET